jgi:hypothetical protein
VTVRLPAPGPIAGATPLPAGFAHPHASEEARLIAEAGLILRVQVGSGVHGTAISGQDDRDELVAVHGYDTKYAMHALRLGLQGIELLTAGRITLPVPEPDREYLRSIRRGERPLAEVLDAVAETEARLERLRDSASLPDEPDRRWVDDWLHRSYTEFWASLR